MLQLHSNTSRLIFTHSTIIHTDTQSPLISFALHYIFPFLEQFNLPYSFNYLYGNIQSAIQTYFPLKTAYQRRIFVTKAQKIFCRFAANNCVRFAAAQSRFARFAFDSPLSSVVGAFGIFKVWQPCWPELKQTLGSPKGRNVTHFLLDPAWFLLLKDVTTYFESI